MDYVCTYVCVHIYTCARVHEANSIIPIGNTEVWRGPVVIILAWKRDIEAGK